MNQRLISVFVFALVISALSSYAIYRVIAGHVQTAAPAATTAILVADHDLEIGALIQSGDVRQISWTGPVPAASFTKSADVVGRGVVTKIFKDEPISGARIAPQGAGAGLAATIPMGMRAVALRVNDVVGLAGFVLPGMRVDVLVTGNVPGVDQNRVGTVSRTVLQNLEVLSANQRIERNSAGKPEDAQVVNLLVTPDQAEVMNLASNEGKVQLVLRNPLDQQQQSTHGSTAASMFGVGASFAPVHTDLTRPARVQPRRTAAPTQLAAALQPPKPVSVEVFSGMKRSEQRFDSVPEAR